MAPSDDLRRVFDNVEAVELFDAPDTSVAPPDDLVAKLGRILQGRRTLLSGNIHLVGLGRIRDRLGADWPRIAARAQEIAQKSIQRACGADDIFTRYDELSFLIIFASLTPEQAQIRCHDIGAEIGQRLLGENFATEAVEVSTGIFEADGSLTFSAVDRRDLIKRLVEAGRKAVPPSSPADDELPDFSFARIDKAKALASIEVMYQPMWNLRHKAISNYFATAGSKSVFGEQLWDDALRAEYADVLTPVEFDVFVARRVLHDAAGFLAQGGRSLIGWPVHFETLATRASRDAYVELCRDIPDAVRKLLILELDGLPEGVASSRLVEMLGILRPFCRSLIVRVPSDFKRFDLFAGIPLGGVGFSLSGNPGSDQQRIGVMNDFVEAASRAGLRSYVHGLGNRAQALAAAAAGFEWINGIAVDRPAELPKPMTRFRIQDLYRDL